MNQTTTTKMITAKNLKPGMVVLTAKGDRRIVNDIFTHQRNFVGEQVRSMELVDANTLNFPAPRWTNNIPMDRLYKVEVGT